MEQYQNSQRFSRFQLIPLQSKVANTLNTIHRKLTLDTNVVPTLQVSVIAKKIQLADSSVFMVEPVVKESSDN